MKGTQKITKPKKFINIKQVRELILKLTKSSFNDKPRFILIDNIEYLNYAASNAVNGNDYETALESVSYTHLTLPTNREV